MNILIDKLPDSVFVDGYELPIRSDHRSCIKAAIAVLDADGDANDLIEILFPCLPTCINLDAVLDAALNFLHGAPMPLLPGQKWGGGDRIPRAYSFLYDQEAIYAAFIQQYHIDLAVETKHWWYFLALLNNLRGNNMADRMLKRTVEEEPDMSKEQKKQIRKERTFWALPNPVAETKQQDAIVQALLNGGEGLEEALGKT